MYRLLDVSVEPSRLVILLSVSTCFRTIRAVGSSGLLCVSLGLRYPRRILKYVLGI